MNGAADARWFAVLGADDAVAGHIAQAQLFDRELAVWRSDDGEIHAWENRCPHRGMRLTMGTNLGAELRCRYHGWRFGASDARCTLIPAHPKQTPPPAAVVQTYRTLERYGLLWVAWGDPATEPALPLDGDSHLRLRSSVVHAPVADVAAALSMDAGVHVHDDYTASTDAVASDVRVPVVLLLQPVTETTTNLHGVAGIELAGAPRVEFLREQNERFKAIRHESEHLRSLVS
jgi:nitrite reductase/ring-hydroxylating ferredoxin subunit